MRKDSSMYNFDERIDRKNTNALKIDGFRDYIFHADDSMKFPYADDEFIHMWVADMEFATPDVVIEGIKKRLDKKILGYTRVFTDDFYKALLSWCQRRYGWSFAREELVTSNGIIPALFELVDYILKEDEKVLFLTPSYAYFKYAADSSNKESVCSDLKLEDGYYTIDFKDLEEKARDPKTKLFIFCNPHNPTGRVWKEEELKKVAKIIEENDLWVISDEIHCDILREGQKHIPLGKILGDYDKLVTCMAASKSFNIAGLMFSSIIIRNENLRKVWNKNHYNFDNPLSIAASQAAYEEGEDWLKEMSKYLDENFKFTKDYLETNLPKVRINISEATYLAWADFGEYFDEDEAITMFFAYKSGVLLEAGNMFVQNSGSFVRLNLACPRSYLKEGLDRIIYAVKNKHKEKYYGE